MASFRSRIVAQLRGFFFDYRRIRTVIFVAAVYVTLSFAYSFIGFIHPQVGPHFHEYSVPRLAIEILGHFAFGFIAALPLVDFDLAALTGGTAVLIDSDHILATIGLDVSGRPDHSVLYAVVSAAVLYSIGRKLRPDPRHLTKLVFVAPVALSAHMAYDLFAGPNQVFQFYIPFSFEFFTLPQYYWILFEMLAVLISGTGYFLSKRLPKRKFKMKPIEQPRDRKV